MWTSSAFHKYKTGVTSIKILSYLNHNPKWRWSCFIFPPPYRKFCVMKALYISNAYSSNLWHYSLHFFEKIFFASDKLPYFLCWDCSSSNAANYRGGTVVNWYSTVFISLADSRAAKRTDIQQPNFNLPKKYNTLDTLTVLA